MNTSPKPGSMRAADAKATRNFFIGAAVVWAFIIALLTVIPNYLNDFFHRAPVVANVLGLILVVGSYCILYFGRDTRGKAITGMVVLAGIVLAFGIALSCGFNFSLFGIAERP